MNEINVIVVPVDLERHTAKRVELSIYMAQKLSASLTFIHVVDHVITGDMMLGSPTTEPLAEERMRRVHCPTLVMNPYKWLRAWCNGQHLYLWTATDKRRTKKEEWDNFRNLTRLSF